ncbi:hypothetical protein [Pelotalea chapellei]|uniref:hypothetical protein n=1 Tax=Pelotalea chapellei TaxID=44671 RepID=UPI001FE480DB|nr:hypothetical protein [Pelotalea chapellei]
MALKDIQGKAVAKGQGLQTNRRGGAVPVGYDWRRQAVEFQLSLRRQGKASGHADTCGLKNFTIYFLALLLRKPMPSRPAPNRRNVEGSGTSALYGVGRPRNITKNISLVNYYNKSTGTGYPGTAFPC